MRLKVTITFEEEYPLGDQQSWPAAAEDIRKRILEGPGDYLDNVRPIPDGRLWVSVKPA